LSYYVQLMKNGDIPPVTKIDREVFPDMKMPTNFDNELKNCLAHYVVACKDNLAVPGQNEEIDSNSIIGYAGLWIMVGEAHVVNIAVSRDFRGKGIGELLLIALFEMAMNACCNLITLEVRASNFIAQKLYEKYGFTVRGVRQGYYIDNREDAVIMTVDDINSRAFEDKFEKLKSGHCQKWGASEIKLSAPLLK